VYTKPLKSWKARVQEHWQALQGVQFDPVSASVGLAATVYVTIVILGYSAMVSGKWY
jgi:hypothetical protein